LRITGNKNHPPKKTCAQNMQTVAQKYKNAATQTHNYQFIIDSLIADSLIFDKKT
jgi:hypothetical protein